MNLVIVESPTKAKTISKFLDSTYKVESSFGHIRDLPISKIGVDIKNDFEPEYIIPDRAQKTVDNLIKLANKADEVILATDEDREGEAIAWHLAQALKLKLSTIQRIAFHEITKPAILEALQNPRALNIDLVDAQQARRIVDRLVGYKLSPFLWKKVARGLSAGRVQSVAVRLIVEREREILAFNKEEYWSVVAKLQTSSLKLQTENSNTNNDFEASLFKMNGKNLDKLAIKSKDEADKILTDLKNANYQVAKIIKKEGKKNPLPPFTTSTLQQTANRLLGFSAKQTMMVAQQLYEGINIKGEGNIGLITYMRTDSLNLAESFLKTTQNYLKTKIGSQYSLTSPRRFKAKSKGAQEAHEAVRPTDPFKTPESLKNSLNPNQFKLYRLIWQRALASQMPEAIVDSVAVEIKTSKKNENLAYEFKATGQTLKFDGYLKIYPDKSEDVILPKMQEGENLDLKELTSNQHFTQPPARYSDAGLVKAMENYGIGRPSTYAPTIATIIERNYVERDDKKRLAPTAIASVVTDLLVNHFKEIIDYDFTANLEKDFDRIAIGKKKWRAIVKDFFTPFIENLKEKEKELVKKDIMPEEKTEEKCNLCGSDMVIKIGRFGKFLSCSKYPECKNAKPLPGEDRDKDGKSDDKEIADLQAKHKDEVCEKCGAPMAVKVGKFGPFLACTAYPKCKNLKSIQAQNASTGLKCPICKEGEIVMKRSRRGPFYTCNRYPDCKTAYSSKPTGKKCKECGGWMIMMKNGEKCGNCKK